MHEYSVDFARVAAHYGDLVRRYQDAPEAAQWSDHATQRRRFEILTNVGDLRASKVLDFGCNTGSLYEFLRDEYGFRGEYVGYDLAEPAIMHARQKFPGICFEVRDILAEGVDQEFEFVLISGVFNNRLVDNWGFLRRALSMLFARTKNAIAFNAMSSYVDYRDESLAYFAPEDVFRFCKETLSARVTLRHDYLVKPDTIPFEFTTYVYQSAFAPRPRVENGLQRAK